MCAQIDFIDHKKNIGTASLAESSCAVIYLYSKGCLLLSDLGPVFISLLSICCESNLKQKNKIDTVVTQVFFLSRQVPL